MVREIELTYQAMMKDVWGTLFGGIAMTDKMVSAESQFFLCNLHWLPFGVNTFP